ncbi:hypothetical protein [Lapillicoccus jejuensis]|uniref:hypothetical protein n=1 Tax=Lapillicoccus jejuensis TaxID=402171 RepID=UPI001154BD3B|nr:hypothetical protein [Lapillicoccus jejuensis]
MATRYGARYGVSIVPAAELGKTSHVNAFTTRQFFAADEELSYRDPATYVQRNVAAIHAQGGLVSWNHPFGATTGRVTTGPAAVTRRRNVYAALAKQDVWGVDILEVGYAVRGSMGIEDHLALWDTFSRHARFLTGNGVSDSHDSAHDRLGFANEFVTGLWSPTTGLGDVLPALSAGRAWTRHARAWAGGRLDLVVDDTYLMGQVAVVGGGVHRLAVAADALPPGSVVEVVAGPVDLQGVDPGTVVLQRLPASAFGVAGVAGCTVDVSASTFVRVTVRSSAGTVIGVSNPVWLLLSAPPTGVPAPRRP